MDTEKQLCKVVLQYTMMMKTCMMVILGLYEDKSDTDEQQGKLVLKYTLVMVKQMLRRALESYAVVYWLCLDSTVR